jgi:hypothetical protein
MIDRIALVSSCWSRPLALTSPTQLETALAGRRQCPARGELLAGVGDLAELHEVAVVAELAELLNALAVSTPRG